MCFGVLCCGVLYLAFSSAPFSLPSGVLKRSRDPDSRVGSRAELGRAGMCVCMDCVLDSELGSSHCVCCSRPTGPGPCPCSCAGCQPVGVPFQSDLPVPAPDLVPWNSAAGIPARHRAPCAYPGCDVLVPWNSVAGAPARCCGSAHERAFVRLDHCPSVIEGTLVPLLVFVEVEMEILGCHRHGKPLISRDRAGSWDSKTTTMSF